MEERRPLRILYHHRVAASDGMRVHINEVVEALRAEGHLVKVVGPDAHTQRRPGEASAFERLAEGLRRALPAALYEALELAYNLPAYLRLRSAARVFRPDVLYERYNLFLLAGLLLKRALRAPMLLEVNAPLLAERLQYGGLRLRFAGRFCEGALWRGADVVLPVTHVLAEQVREARGGLHGVHVVANGADPGRRPPAARVSRVRRELGLEPEDLVLGFVGFVRDWHGLTDVVQVLPDLPASAHLVVVGDGPGCAALRELAEGLGVGRRVHLLGRAPHDQVAAYMASFDVALQAGATPYASPLKLFEYMALGRAIVAPDQPNIREVLTAGLDALLFRPGDREDLKRVLQQLTGDRELRGRLGAAAAHKVVTAPFTWRGNAAKIATLARTATASSVCASPDVAPSGAPEPS